LYLNDDLNNVDAKYEGFVSQWPFVRNVILGESKFDELEDDVVPRWPLNVKFDNLD
jgi:hypothetical protein